MNIRELALNLCWKIEKLPASELQTEISKMASTLLHEVIGQSVLFECPHCGNKGDDPNQTCCSHCGKQF